MEDIQSHSWFTEEKYYNLSLLPRPPTPDEIGMPLKSSSQMDDRIMETLKVLWNDLSKGEIMDALLSDESVSFSSYTLWLRSNPFYIDIICKRSLMSCCNGVLTSIGKLDRLMTRSCQLHQPKEDVPSRYVLLDRTETHYLASRQSSRPRVGVMFSQTATQRRHYGHLIQTPN